MLKRNYPVIERFLSKNSSILLLGPRGTGKTHFIKTALGSFENTLAYDLLSTTVFERYLRRPELFAQEVTTRLKNSTKPLLVFVDEIQRLPSLLNEIHSLIETHKPAVAFILTGSSARKLKQEDANLLAGRALHFEFFPLGIDEIEYSSHELSLLQFGSLPQPFSESDIELKIAYLETYVGVYLQEEIQREAQLRNLAAFSRFLELAASYNGQVVNYAKTAEAVGVSDLTVKEYYRVLVDTLIVHAVPAWSYSICEQLQKAPKYFLFDNGIINALLGDLRSDLRPSTYRYGKLFENFVVTQLFQAKSKGRIPVSISHYRTANGKEIDLIIQKNPHSPPVAVEMKSSVAPKLSDVPTLKAFRDKYESSRTVVLCRSPNGYEEGGVEFLPVEEGIARVLRLAVDGS